MSEANAIESGGVPGRVLKERGAAYKNRSAVRPMQLPMFDVVYLGRKLSTGLSHSKCFNIVREYSVSANRRAVNLRKCKEKHETSVCEPTKNGV